MTEGCLLIRLDGDAERGRAGVQDATGLTDGKEVGLSGIPASKREKGQGQGSERVGRQGAEARTDTPGPGTLLCLISFDSNREGSVFPTSRKQREEAD